MKKLLSLLMCLCLILSTFTFVGITASAEIRRGKCGDNLTWSLDTESCELVISGTGDMYDYYYCYHDCNSPWYSYYSYIKSITIGNGVTSIGDYAFCGCYYIRSMQIPESITSIGDCAFLYCNYLSSFVVDNNNQFYSSYNDVLFNKDKTILIKYPCANERRSYEIPSSVTTVEQYSFDNSDSLYSVIIPDSVTDIGDYAFNSCASLKNVTISNGVTSIGDHVFEYCSLTSVIIPNGVTSIGECAFRNCDLISVTIPNNVKRIGSNAFAGCYYMKNITIPDSVTSIGSNAFYECPNLEAKVYCNNKYAYIYLMDSDVETITTTHEFKNFKSNNDATCLEFGTETAKCERCDETYTRTEEDSKLDHNFSVLKYDENKHWYQCTGCDETYEESLMLNHDFSVLQYDENGHWYKCLICDKTANYKEHFGGTATCEEKAMCLVCGQEYGQSLGHNFVKYKSNNDATCLEFGTETAKCERCDETYTREDINSALGHEYCSEWSVDKEAICVNGEMSHHCIRYDECGSKTDVITIPAKHTESGWEIVLEATDTAQGVRRKICINCGKTLKTEYYNKHTHSYKWTDSKPATHFSAGEQVNKCSTCGEVLSKKAIAKLTYTAPSITGGKKKITVKYKAVSGATGFEVRYKIKGKWKTVKYTTKKAKTIAIKKLKKGKYQVQVRAVKGKVKTNWSKVKKITVK